MKIALTSTGKELASEMDPRFGRAAYFIVVDPDTLEYEVVENTENVNISQGAGIQAGKIIVDKGAEVLITGFCGPKAYKVLESAGVKTIMGATGRVKDVVENYKAGKYKETDAPNVGEHWE
jgi:predicted Fe-Mo cluster-binding NifX family protein